MIHGNSGARVEWGSISILWLVKWRNPRIEANPAKKAREIAEAIGIEFRLGRGTEPEPIPFGDRVFISDAMGAVSGPLPY